MKRASVKISEGNSKVGRIPNLSLIPIKACGACFGNCKPPCAKQCYALKAWKQYPDTRAAWTLNYTLARKDLNAFFEGIRVELAKRRKLPFFRWHVAGDILSPEYLEGMVYLAELFPETKFLAFTKQYRIVNEYQNDLPPNLTIVFSAWPGLTIENPKRLPVAYMIPENGEEPRVTKRTIRCPGNCESCGMCWDLPRLKRDVAFNEH